MKRAPKIDDETGAELEEAIRELFRDGVPDTQAATLLTEGKKYDTEQYHLRHGRWKLLTLSWLKLEKSTQMMVFINFIVISHTSVGQEQ
ncbi:hypothetical protein FRC08_006609 [Ceratobasidium sp. 394]|nr:hypothetical protein FRC08_006609 [Ceratobasidium sp. 394]